MKGPTQLWQTSLLTEARHELQPVARLTSPRAATAIYQAKKSKGRKARSAQEKEFSSQQMQTYSPEESYSQVQIERPPNSSRFRGRLGHLVSAIADAHKAATSTGQYTVTGIAPSHTSNPTTQVRRRAWSATAAADSRPPFHARTAHHDDNGSHLQVQDSPNSSYSDIEVHMCSKCDRMYHCRGDLEEHERLCEL